MWFLPVASWTCWLLTFCINHWHTLFVSQFMMCCNLLPVYSLSSWWAILYFLSDCSKGNRTVCLVLYLWEGQLSDCWKLTFFFLNLFVFQCHWSWIHLSPLWLPLWGTVCFSSCHAQYRIDYNPSEDGFAYFQILQITETLLMGRSRDQGSKKKKEILQNPEVSLIGKNPSLCDPCPFLIRMKWRSLASFFLKYSFSPPFNPIS